MAVKTEREREKTKFSHRRICLRHVGYLYANCWTVCLRKSLVTCTCQNFTHILNTLENVIGYSLQFCVHYCEKKTNVNHLFVDAGVFRLRWSRTGVDLSALPHRWVSTADTDSLPSSCRRPSSNCWGIPVWRHYISNSMRFSWRAQRFAVRLLAKKFNNLYQIILRYSLA